MLGKNANTKRGNLAGKQWIEGPSLSLWFFRECAFVHVHKSKSDLSDICSLTFFSMITFIGIFESYSSLKRESCYIPPQFTLTFVRLDLRCIGRIYLLSYYWPTGTGIVEKEGKLKKKKKKGHPNMRIWGASSSCLSFIALPWNNCDSLPKTEYLGNGLQRDKMWSG